MATRLFRALRSVKLAVVLLASLAVILGIGGLSASPLFYGVTVLFVLNLGACTAHRLLGQLKKKKGRRFGPDILHLGLLVLIVGAILGAATKRESSFWMSPGDSVLLPDGRSLELLDFKSLSYPDGRPEAWISTVALGSSAGVASPRRIAIEVNHPLRLGSLSIFQSSWARLPGALFTESSGRRIRVFAGDTVALEGAGSHTFVGDRGEGAARSAILRETGAPGAPPPAHEYRPGEGPGAWKLVEIRDLDVTGLRASTDPGYPVVFAGFILIALGLCLTYFQKLKDMKP